eukprot:gb/GFBE01078457.1/.p1 GENE.gb/GFBE01078457.1/~~gb/GFBE01078457.1/.p1  ORF type:complete len:224 (+),score=21.93 gb/GFBE01078457.1/:1-672(+)
MQQLLDQMPPRAVWAVHSNFLANPAYRPPGYIFINMIRNPISRLCSIFYYGVDPVARNRKVAMATLRDRQKQGVCGCAALEFHECIDAQVKNGCPLDNDGASQARHFCPKADRPCSGRQAFKNILTTYTLVGITERMKDSLALFEKLLPQWFAGATKAYAGLPRARVSRTFNRMTNTSLTGYVPEHTKALIMKHWTLYHSEAELYNAVAGLLERKLAKFGVNQ